jgi:hypothetical protein
LKSFIHLCTIYNLTMQKYTFFPKGIHALLPVQVPARELTLKNIKL